MTPPNKQKKWKRLLPSVLWTLAGTGLFILLVSAVGRNGRLRCSGLEISIEGYKHEMFINEADVKSLIEEDLSHKVKGCVIEAMNLRRLEGVLQKDNWVSKAQLFVDNKQLLHVNISERIPVARIFTQGNRSYYIDSQAVILPLSEQQVADVPVFTNLPDRPQKLAGTDSAFWQQIGKMGNYIINDSFLLMQAGQINVTQQKELELYPVIGNHIVLLGTPEKFAEKLSRLKKFDQQVLAKAGLNKYSRLDLRYDKQIVATLRGQEGIPPPQINISPDVEIAATTPPDDAEHKTNEAIAKAEIKQPEKRPEIKQPPKPDNRPAAVVKKAPQKQETAKKEPAKTEKRTEKSTVATARKKTTDNDKKIMLASSNKTDKNALKQVPKKTENSGIVEIDIRKKADDKKSQPRAVMPKKQ